VNGSFREKILLTCFPAVMIALLWWGWLRPSQTLATIQQALAAEAATAVSSEQLASKSAALVQLQEELKAVDLIRANYQTDWNQLRSTFATAAVPSSTLDQIAAILRDHQLKWIAGERLPSQHDAEIGRNFQQLLHQLQAANPLPKTAETTPDRIDYSAITAPQVSADTLQVATKQFWKIECAGDYTQVKAALESLGTQVQQAIPLQIRMSPADPTLKIRRWTFILAI
jgi:hypothetical protein